MNPIVYLKLVCKSIILVDLKENSNYLVKFKNKEYNKIIHGAERMHTIIKAKFIYFNN